MICSKFNVFVLLNFSLNYCKNLLNVYFVVFENYSQLSVMLEKLLNKHIEKEKIIFFSCFRSIENERLIFSFSLPLFIF